MKSASRRVAPGVRAEVRFTDRADGDFGLGCDPAELGARRSSVVDRPWTWVRQSHGGLVAVADAPGSEGGADADAAVTAVHGAPVSVLTADCVPIALIGRADGSDAGLATIAAVHAGWRGIVAGVIGAAVNSMRALGTGPIEAIVGPHIGPGSYEFGVEDLAVVSGAVGIDVSAMTTEGAPALDLGTAVSASLEAAGVTTIGFIEADTAEPEYFSHRLRGDLGRQTLVVWLEADEEEN